MAEGGTPNPPNSPNPPNLKIWAAGASKIVHCPSGRYQVGGFGVVVQENILRNLFGPLSENLTEDANQNVAELRAVIYGLNFAKTNGFDNVEMVMDSEFLESIMTKWLKKWKNNGWKNRCGGELEISSEILKTIDRLNCEMQIKWTGKPTKNCPKLRDALRDALRSQWPTATLLLCLFHFLQQVWRDGCVAVKIISILR